MGSQAFRTDGFARESRIFLSVGRTAVEYFAMWCSVEDSTFSVLETRIFFFNVGPLIDDPSR